MAFRMSPGAGTEVNNPTCRLNCGEARFMFMLHMKVSTAAVHAPARLADCQCRGSEAVCTAGDHGAILRPRPPGRIETRRFNLIRSYFRVSIESRGRPGRLFARLPPVETR